MIELRNLTKSYRTDDGIRRYVFRDLSFTFPGRQNIALIGRNGAGKSTLMRLLGGIDKPDSGMVLTEKTISWPVGLSGGFQGTLSGRDNVKFVCRIFGAVGTDMHDRIRFVEDFAEIGDYFDQPVKSYSSGMRSRLAFGLSMAFDFDYYLIDEVLAVGDAQFKRKSKKVLEERLKHSNLILVTHNMVEVDKLCDVVVLVQDGQTILYTDVRAGIRVYQGDIPPPIPQPRQSQGPLRSAKVAGEPLKAGQTRPRGMVPKRGGPNTPGPFRPGQGKQLNRAVTDTQHQGSRQGGSPHEQIIQPALSLSPALDHFAGEPNARAIIGRSDPHPPTTQGCRSARDEGDDR